MKQYDEHLGPLKLDLDIERWPLLTPFRTAVHTIEFAEVLVARIETNGLCGRGEAVGVHYRGERASSIRDQILTNRVAIEGGITRNELQGLFSPGGARNAVDCALWDLEAKMKGLPVWEIAQVGKPRPLLTTFTCSADAPENMARSAREFAGAQAIKIKLTGEVIDGDRIRAVREARPDVWLGVDANQSLSISLLEGLLGVLAEAEISLLEQPFPIGKDAWLDGVCCPIPVAADESMQSLADIPALVGRYKVCNIKLDKCGGLTEGLAMARAALGWGLEPMVGTMMTTFSIHCSRIPARAIVHGSGLGQSCIS